MNAPLTTPIVENNYPTRAFATFLNYLQSYLLPRGAIVLFYATTSPKGFVDCDGTNGTPNLTAPTGCVYGMKL